MSHSNMNSQRKVLYFGFAVPKKSQDEVARLDRNPHFATHNFSWSLVRALRSGFGTVSVISTLEIRNWPAVPKVFFRSKQFVEQDIWGTQIGFVNIIFFKHVSRLFQLIVRLKAILSGKKYDLFVLHGTHTPFMIFSLIAKMFGKKILIVLTDQHGIEVQNDGIVGRVLRRIDTYLMTWSLKKVDGYVCLSPSFIKKYQLRRVLVMPGILSSEYLSLLECSRSMEERTCGHVHFVYAGLVSARKGVDLLLEAVQNCQDERLCLTIFGGGELVPMVIRASKKDHRIMYGGIVSYSKIVTGLLSADVLVNPTPTGLDFTQSLFPSKLIEYMATGRAILTTKLISIPEEIEDCFLYVENSTPESLNNAVCAVLGLPREELIRVGNNAREKVKRYFSEEVIGSRIRDLAAMF